MAAEDLFVMYETNYGSWNYPVIPGGWTYVGTDDYKPTQEGQTIIFSHEAHFRGPSTQKAYARAFLEEYFHRLKTMKAIKEFKVRNHYLPYTH